MRPTKKVLPVLLVTALGALLLWQGTGSVLDTRRLKAEGKSVTAKVLEGRTVYRSKGRTQHYLTVEFQTQTGQTLRSEIPVDYATQNQGNAQHAVTVWYVPAAPRICQAGAHPSYDFWNLILGAITVLVGLASLPSLWRPSTRQELADRVSERLDRLCDADARYEPVEAAKYRHLDLAFYNSTQQRFEEHGFVFLEDVEEVRARPHPDFTPTFMRLLLSRDGTTVGYVFHVKPAWKLRLAGAKEARTYGAVTRFGNQTSVGTDNAATVAALDPVPGFNDIHLPAGNSLELVLHSHEQRRAAHALQQGGAQPVRIHGVEELHRLMLESHARKAAYRRDHGLSKRSLEKLGGTIDNPVINDLHADLTQRAEERRRAA